MIANAYFVSIPSGVSHLCNLFCFDMRSNTHALLPICFADSGPDSLYTGNEICFNYNEDTLTIVDVTIKGAPVQLGRIGYRGAAYTHQGWLTDDGRHVIVDDEVDETGTVYTKTHVFHSTWGSTLVPSPRITTSTSRAIWSLRRTTGLDCKIFESKTSTRHR